MLLLLLCAVAAANEPNVLPGHGPPRLLARSESPDYVIGEQVLITVMLE